MIEQAIHALGRFFGGKDLTGIEDLWEKMYRDSFLLGGRADGDNDIFVITLNKADGSYAPTVETIKFDLWLWMGLLATSLLGLAL
jgi:hypothetical protein